MPVPSTPVPGTGRPALPWRAERLLLRTLRHGDEADMLAYRRREDVCRFMLEDPLDEATVAEHIAARTACTAIAADGDKIVLAAELDGRVIGDVVIKAGRIADRQAEVGWAFHPGYHGRGYATEAARGLLEIAFTELRMHRAWAQLDPRNTASARLCERLGMRREALFAQDMWFKGEWGDTAVYALLAAEWRASAAAARTRTLPG